MEENRELKLTTLNDLEKYSKGQLVKLPPFAEGQPFVARIKRPSMLQMVANGTIPNVLLIKAQSLFLEQTEGFDPDDENMMKEMLQILEIVAKESLLEPKYEQIKECGLQLTDDQLMFLYNYSQQGIKILEPFRTE